MKIGGAFDRLTAIPCSHFGLLERIFQLGPRADLPAGAKVRLEADLPAASTSFSPGRRRGVRFEIRPSELDETRAGGQSGVGPKNWGTQPLAGHIAARGSLHLAGSPPRTASPGEFRRPGLPYLLPGNANPTAIPSLSPKDAPKRIPQLGLKARSRPRSTTSPRFRSSLRSSPMWASTTRRGDT